MTYVCVCVFFAAAARINEALKPLATETGRMKRDIKDPRDTPEEPSFFRKHPEGSKAEAPGTPRGSFRPAWGFRKQDTVVGSTEHAKDWSLHSITPCDYKDMVVKGELP